jgi:hypothetical protein
MDPYSKPKVFLGTMRLIIFVRFTFVVMMIVVSMLFCFPQINGTIHPPRWWGVLFLSILAVGSTSAILGLILATIARCDVCGRRPLILRSLPQPRPFRWRRELETLQGMFFPDELRCRAFKCPHCGREFSL